MWIANMLIKTHLQNTL